MLFLTSLVFVQWMEVARKQEEAGLRRPDIAVPAELEALCRCHEQTNPGIVAHWKDSSTHARRGGLRRVSPGWMT